MSLSSAQGVTLCLAVKAGIAVVALLMVLANSEPHPFQVQMSHRTSRVKVNVMFLYDQDVYIVC